MLLADSDLVQISTAFIALVGTCFSGFMAYLMAKLNVKATQAAEMVQVAAVKVAAVKVALDKTTLATDEKLNGLANVAKATHTLVNSNMGAQLLLNATLARRLAILTKDLGDEKAAALAESLYRDHQTKQAAVDASAAATAQINQENLP